MAILLYLSKRKKALYTYYGTNKGISLIETFKEFFLDKYYINNNNNNNNVIASPLLAPIRIYIEREERRREYILEDDFFNSSNNKADYYIDKVEAYLSLRIIDKDILIY